MIFPIAAITERERQLEEERKEKEQGATAERRQHTNTVPDNLMAQISNMKLML